jgi:hypothetical protein
MLSTVLPPRSPLLIQRPPRALPAELTVEGRYARTVFTQLDARSVKEARQSNYRVTESDERTRSQ